MRSLAFYLKEMFAHTPGGAASREDDIFDDYGISEKTSVTNIHYKIVGAQCIVFSSIYFFAENVGCSFLSDHCWRFAHGSHLLVARMIAHDGWRRKVFMLSVC